MKTIAKIFAGLALLQLAYHNYHAMGFDLIFAIGFYWISVRKYKKEM